MLIIGIDPGPTKTAWVELDPDPLFLVASGYEDNETVARRFRYNMDKGLLKDPQFAIEMIASYGMPVGKEVFETCLWIGKFIEHWGGASLVYRKQVAVHICNSVKASDANVRQGILDLFPRTGGGKTPQIGTKKEPGPLFGVSGDIWSALGVALTFSACGGQQHDSIVLT